MVRDFFAPIVMLVAFTAASGAQNISYDDLSVQTGFPTASTENWIASLPDFLQNGLVAAAPPAFLFAQPEPQAQPTAQIEAPTIPPIEQWTAAPPDFLQNGLVAAAPPAFLFAQPEPQAQPAAQSEAPTITPIEQWTATPPDFLQNGLVAVAPPAFLFAQPEPQAQPAAQSEAPTITPIEQWTAAPPDFLQNGLVAVAPPAFLNTSANDAKAMPSAGGPCATGGAQPTPAGRFHFYAGSARLDPNARRAISEIAARLKQCPAILVEVGGHTDNIGDPEANMALAKRRATAIIAALEAQGIDGRRLYWRSYGASNPIAANDTRAGRALNRRIDVVLR
jgi:outer membrane protein OmpA-like peptidoglycan-associated protein